MQLQYLTTKQAAHRLNLSPRFLEERRRRGNGPEYVRISATCVRYSPEALREWAANRTFRSLADEAAHG